MDEKDKLIADMYGYLTAYAYDDDWEECNFCGAQEWGPEYHSLSELSHREDCIWWRSYQYVKENNLVVFELANSEGE